MMAYLKQNCKVYGFLGAFTAITCAVASLLVTTKDELCYYDKLQCSHMIGIIGGIVLCICGIINIAELLYGRIICLFRIGTLAIVGLCVVQAYAASNSFNGPCGLAFGTVSRLLHHNVFTAPDLTMIGVFILDICSTLMFFFASIMFFRRM